MLKRVEKQNLKDLKDACVLAKDAKFPSPFDSKLEFSCSARGPWNIVHTGMLIPQAHEVYVCAQSCLRGVVLTAAEMNAIDRFSNIIVRENNILEGDTEDLKMCIRDRHIGMLFSKDIFIPFGIFFGLTLS